MTKLPFSAGAAVVAAVVVALLLVVVVVAVVALRRLIHVRVIHVAAGVRGTVKETHCLCFDWMRLLLLLLLIVVGGLVRMELSRAWVLLAW
jgi:hypothetical protein